MKRYSELTFKDILNSNFCNFSRVVWNGKEIFSDIDSIVNTFDDYMSKHIYSFYCRIVDFHHTELYIEGEK